MAKRLTEKQKKIILNSFKKGETIEDLSKEFKCTNSTIIRNLKKDLGETNYKELFKKIKNSSNKNNFNENKIFNFNNTDVRLEPAQNDRIQISNLNKVANDLTFPSYSEFTEIAPIDYEIENVPRKDLSSVPIGEIEFPKIVYMIVSKNIELEIKLLKDYPDWQFLPNEELKRKTIEIYFDLKTANRICNKEQKVIKVPNTDVFRIASPFLISRGISRIVSAEKLIAI